MGCSAEQGDSAGGRMIRDQFLLDLSRELIIHGQ